MSNLKPRGVQTEVKHEILDLYLFKWGVIISSGLKRVFQKQQLLDRQFDMRFVYVDCFAYKGRYAPQDGSDTPIYGSPVIGIESLDKVRDFSQNQVGFRPDVISILFERERNEYNDLLKTLQMRGHAERIRETANFRMLRSGDIAVVNGDFKDYLQTLLDFTGQDYTWAFYLLDPYGPSGISLQVVSKIISQARHDVMINFPYMDLHRKTGSAVHGIPEHEKHVVYFDEVYGSQEWQETAKPYYDELSDRREEMEGRLVDLYRDVLNHVDNDLTVKTIRLKFPAMERTMFYLFLTTHDPTGAIALNEILDEAQAREHELREAHRDLYKRGGQLRLGLFDDTDDPAKPKHVEPDPKEVASIIYQRCKGERIQYREVLKRMAEEPYYRGTIRKAMTQLRKDKKALYGKGTLGNNKYITFK